MDNADEKLDIKKNLSMNSVVLMRFLMGFLLALALFCIELGVSQIVLNKDAHCRQLGESGRLLTNLDEECLSEGAYYFMVTLSRGPFSSSNSSVQPIIASSLAGMIYGILGGLLAVFARKYAIIIFLGIHVLILIIFTFIAYITNFIA